MNLPTKKTKIVCTIGPASQSPEVLRGMISNGMNVARLNFAHGDRQTHRQVIEQIRSAAADADQSVAIMGDLPGPKMRIGHLAEDPVYLERGQTFILQTKEIVGDRNRVSQSFKELTAVVKAGDLIYLNDGFIQLVVKRVSQEEVFCEVLVGGELRSHKGINLPGIDLGTCAFTAEDQQWLHFAAQENLDAISQSFVQNAADIQTLRDAAQAIDYHPFIIAKIERSRALDNLDEILKVSDGIMVARGDLGVEIAIEKVAMVQKQVIRQANLRARPVITATQMLESMVDHTRPTRAEATDVANAILDGSDCVMLSGETATGDFPVEAVTVMANIAREVEPNVHGGEVSRLLKAAQKSGKIDVHGVVSLSIYSTVEVTKAVVVMSPTLSGRTARQICRFRLPAWIIAVSPNETTCQGLQFSYGVHPVLVRERPSSWPIFARDWLNQHGFIEGLAVLTHGTGTALGGGTNQMEILDLGGGSEEVVVW